MKRLALLIAFAILAGVVALTARAPRHAAAQQAASMYLTEIPSGYRDWTLISFTYEEGDLHRFAAVLGECSQPIIAAIQRQSDARLLATAPTSRLRRAL